jgi:hypothetical protein
MGLDKLQAALAKAKLVLSTVGMEVLREDGVPEDVLLKLDLIERVPIARPAFYFELARILTPEEVKAFGAMIEAASQPTCVQMTAGEWLDACNEINIAIHAGPNTAGQVARKIANAGIRHQIPDARRPIEMVRPNAKAKMSFDITHHVMALLEAASKKVIPVTDPNSPPKPETPPAV